MACGLSRCVYTSTTSEKPENSLCLCFGCRDPYLDGADWNISPCKKKKNNVITKRKTPHMKILFLQLYRICRSKKKYFLQKIVSKVMPHRKVPNTEDNEKMDHRFDFSVNDSVS